MSTPFYSFYSLPFSLYLFLFIHCLLSSSPGMVILFPSQLGSQSSSDTPFLTVTISHAPFPLSSSVVIIYIIYCNSSQRSNLCVFITITIYLLSVLFKQSGAFPVSNISFLALVFTSVDRAWMVMEM